MIYFFGNYCSHRFQSWLKYSHKWVNEVEWALKVILWPWSKVTHISKLKLVFRRNSWRFGTKLHLKAYRRMGMKNYTNESGHMTKMAQCPYMVKTFKKSSSEPIDRWPWNLVCSIMWASTNKMHQIMTLGWPWPILLQGQILVMKNCENKRSVLLFDLWHRTLTVLQTSPQKLLGQSSQNFVEALQADGRKVCSNGPGYMTSMAAMLVHGKNLYNSFLEPVDWLPWNFIYSIGY